MPYKQFTNGSPLPASDLQNFLMDQSVMTFANATARTTALPTPKEGMVTWLEDSNRLDVWSGSAWILVNDNAASVPLSTVTTAGDLIVANGNASVTRLGIGANNTILTSNGTTAVWAAAAGGGGLTLLSTTTLSGNTVDINSINQTFRHLRIEFEEMQSTVNDDDIIVYARNGTTTMNNTIVDRTFSGASWSDNISGGGGFFLTRWLGVNSNLRGSFTVEFSNYATSNSIKPMIGYGLGNGGNQAISLNFGAFMSTSAINSIRIFLNNGTFSNGSVRVFGVS